MSSLCVCVCVCAAKNSLTVGVREEFLESNHKALQTISNGCQNWSVLTDRAFSDGRIVD